LAAVEELVMEMGRVVGAVEKGELVGMMEEVVRVVEKRNGEVQEEGEETEKEDEGKGDKRGMEVRVTKEVIKEERGRRASRLLQHSSKTEQGHGPVSSDRYLEERSLRSSSKRPLPLPSRRQQNSSTATTTNEAKAVLPPPAPPKTLRGVLGKVKKSLQVGETCVEREWNNKP
jgi:hypothetical protein